MKAGSGVLMALLASVQPCLAASAEPIRLELNALESVNDRCRATFVVENKNANQIDSLKLDLVIFDKDGIIDQRLVVEMGPLRGAKTAVKAFDFGGDCGKTGSVLLNDVTACSLAEPEACLGRLVLSSKLSNVRFFK